MIAKNGHILHEAPNGIAGHLKFSKRMAREFREAVRAFDLRKKSQKPPVIAPIAPITPIATK